MYFIIILLSCLILDTCEAKYSSKKPNRKAQNVVNNKLSHSNETKPLLMYDFAVTNYDFNEVNYTNRWECYGNVDNANIRILGLNRNTRCYVTTTFMFNTIGDKKYSRCGTQILITGPSQKTVI
ncbi:hypothetical protein EIN_072060, partial [Entamoeba invadens IP1]